MCGRDTEISWQDLKVDWLRVDWLRVDFVTRNDLGLCEYYGVKLTGFFEFSPATAYSARSAEELQHPLTLFNILECTAHRYAMDPRDKVFAVLGLVRDAHVASLTPDYSQTISEVYQQATVNILQSGCNLELL